MNTLLRSAVCLGALTAGFSAHAQVLVYGNNTGFDTFNNVADSSVGDSSAAAGEQRAAGFTTGGTTLTLDHVALALGFDSVGAGSTTVSVSIWSSVGGAPGTSLTTLSASTLVNSSTASTFTFNNSMTLTANTTYWIVVDNLGGGAGGSFNWAKATANGGNGTTPTSSNGSGYQSEGFLVGSGGDYTGGAVPDHGNIAIYTTAVPEPREYALIAGVGLCAFAAYRRRNIVKA